MEFIIILIMLGFLYLIFKPKAKPKSKEQKQYEILEEYKDKMDRELSQYADNKDVFLKKKTELLKVFGKELNNNLFFDVDETRELIQKLVSYEVK